MEGIEGVEGELNKLVEGTMTNYINCVNVDYKSERKEKFNFIQLQVKDMKDIYQSLDLFTTEVRLEAENQYDAGDIHGKQDAIKGIKFDSLPPVLFL